MKIVKTILAVSVLALAGCNDQPTSAPFKVTIRSEPDRSPAFLSLPPGSVIRSTVVLTSLVDHVTLKRVIVNNGNPKCDAVEPAELPRDMSMGDEYRAVISLQIGSIGGGCHVVRVEAVTSTGNYAWSFSR